MTAFPYQFYTDKKPHNEYLGLQTWCNFHVAACSCTIKSAGKAFPKTMVASVDHVLNMPGHTMRALCSVFFKFKINLLFDCNPSDQTVATCETLLWNILGSFPQIVLEQGTAVTICKLLLDNPYCFQAILLSLWKTLTASAVTCSTWLIKSNLSSRTHRILA